MSTLARDNSGQVIQAFAPGAGQRINVGSSSTQSAVLADTTRVVRVCANVRCFLAFGSNPTATTTGGFPLPADAVEYIAVVPGSRIAVIRDTVDGNLSICEMR